MDCRNIDTRLKQIRRETNKLRAMLGGGNTGKQFHTALDVLEIHLQAIRAEVSNYRLPSQEDREAERIDILNRIERL